MRMDSEMIGILLSDSMHYTIVVSLEMSDEPKKNSERTASTISFSNLSHCRDRLEFNTFNRHFISFNRAFSLYAILVAKSSYELQSLGIETAYKNRVPK